MAVDERMLGIQHLPPSSRAPRDPAFPLPPHGYEKNMGVQAMRRREGMTMLEAFALRAPTAVPDWFQPEVPAPAPLPDVDPPAALPDNVRFILDGWRRDSEESLSEDFLNEHPAARAWHDAWTETWRAQSVRGDLLYRARMAQWPWAWARMVLDAQPGVQP